MTLPDRAPVQPLPAERLYRRCDPAQFNFRTTGELEDLAGFLGQERALGAIEFGVGMRREGYHVFAMGPQGVGRHTIVRRQLEGEAAKLPPPSDWCYVFNFKEPHRPHALELPAGQAGALRASMERLVEDLRVAVPAAFETEEYRNRAKGIEAAFEERQETAFNELAERARAEGVVMLRTPTGLAVGPAAGDGVMESEAFAKLPPKTRERLQALIVKFQDELEQLLHEMPKWRRETLRKLRELSREVTRRALNGLLEELRVEYGSLPQVRQYLAEAQEDMLEHAEVFRQSKEAEPPMLMGIALGQRESPEAVFRRYAVNVLIDHSDANGAPIVYEDKPAHDALVGRIEHQAQMGTLVTDFTLIKAGALHRANGGYLILDALKVLAEPFAWDALKRALRSREIRTQSLGQALSLISTVSLEPQPVPFDVKVVLVGPRFLYYLLHAYDPDFPELFKVAADFDEEMARSSGNDHLYARLIATLARKEGLRALQCEAVARVIEQQSRLAADAEKLSANMQSLVDLVRESDYWAARAGRELITAQDVARAIEAQVARSDRLREKLLEETLRGTLLIDSAGERVGQVNGLAVTQLGSFAFGAAHRITARLRLGAGRVVDIEREAELGGPIHSKGVMILSGYLAGRYAPSKPLSIAATLVFEQSYGGVEGDSASSAELYALLSALADAPIRQSLAVTGSVNQHGDVQAIGGVNQKIEGFFDLCRARGLRGDQGVIIPQSNVKNLMLREDVVAAVAQGSFRIYAVRSVDEGIALLTGLPAATVHARVEQRLADYAERARAFGAELKRAWRPEKPKK
jgi:lon-related putative ATP-dependent protease